jgi:hypothetical protein
MGELETVAAALVTNIRSRFPHYLDAPFTVREMLEQIIPYRICRTEAGVDNSEDYELMLARLVSGEGDFLAAPVEVKSKLRTMLDSPFPDPAALRSFQNTSLTLSATALSAPRAAAGNTPPRTQRRSVKKTANAVQKEIVMPPSQRTTTAAALGGKCRYCHGALPEGREITYCPHCGQDLTVHHCPACSSEIQVGWKFCVTCGRSVE